MTNKSTCVMLDAWTDLSLSPITMNALDCTNCFLHCGDRLFLQPRRSHLLLDVVSQFFQSLQLGIMVMGLIDAFEISGRFGDNTRGRISFMTAITPAFVPA